jgi:hypothetical protein
MKHESILVDGELWTFEHLDPFSFPYTIVTGGADVQIYVDVVFSCHCFSRERAGGEQVPVAWLYATARETRVLDRDRYELSRQHLRALLSNIDGRRILFAGPENFFTVEGMSAEGVEGFYQVFFVVTRKANAARRLELKVQSAYFVSELHRRATPASMRKVRFKIIATAAFEGRRLHAGR